MRPILAIAIVSLGAACSGDTIASRVREPVPMRSVIAPAAAGGQMSQAISAIAAADLQVLLDDVEFETIPEGAATVGGRALVRSRPYSNPRVFKPP